MRNHTKILSELVSLEAWYSTPNSDNKCNLHVDVAFLSSKAGEEEQSKVRFELGLKRAEVSFHIPPTEPIKVVQSSVAKEAQSKGIISSELVSDSKSSLDAKGNISASSNPSISAQLSATTSLSNSRTSVANLTKEVFEIEWRHFRNASGDHTWEVRSIDGQVMQGRPWDPASHTSLQFKIDPPSKLEPNTRIYIKCRREDLDIKGIELKSESKARAAILDRFKTNRMAAAEAYIKAKLQSEGLSAGNLSEKFSGLLLAEAVVDPEVE